MIGFFRNLFKPAEATLFEAQTSDAAALAVLHGQSFRRGWSEAEFEQLLIERQVLADAAAFGRALAGFVMSRQAADEAEILSVAVTPQRRRRGLATQLLARHLSKLARQGVARVFLEVDEQNAAACRLYRSAGFREVGRREGYYGESGGQRSAALVLRRDLA